jgi:hypothetical protein
MMAERDRLTGLEMGEARHDVGCMLFRTSEQGGLKRVDALNGRVHRTSHEQPEIGRHLIIARPRSVQPSRRISDQLGQAVLDMHVNVFELWILMELSGLDFGRDLAKPLIDRCGIFGRQYPLLAEHGGVGAAGGDVLAP